MDAAQDPSADLLVGADLLRRTARRARGEDKRSLIAVAGRLAEAKGRVAASLAELVFGDELAELARRYPDRAAAASSAELSLFVDRERAPLQYVVRALSPIGLARSRPARHTGRCEARLPYLTRWASTSSTCLPSIPSGRPTGRATTGCRRRAGRPGLARGPSAQPTGGHTAVHPELGSMEDVDAPGRRSGRPWHRRGPRPGVPVLARPPWVAEHPEWFRHRPTAPSATPRTPRSATRTSSPWTSRRRGWRGLWDALLEVVEFWIDQGITVFRVDNPHTKPFGSGSG